MQSVDQRRFNRLALLAIVSGFSLLVATFVFVIQGFKTNERANDLIVHTYEVKDALSQMLVNLERSETARRGALLQPSPQRAETYRIASALVLPALQRVDDLTSDSAVQQNRVAMLRPLLLAELATLDDTFDTIAAGRLDEARREFGDRTEVDGFRQIRSLAREIATEEQKLLQTRIAQENGSAEHLQWLLALAGGLLSAVGVAVYFLVRRYTQDLNASRERLHALNTNLEGLVDERTADLKRANEEIQRFAYIVSHDLRSPLVNVMGFTAELETANKAIGGFVDRVEAEKPELVTQDIQYAAREDLPESIGFIRSSTQKMDRLINAILNLSRQGRRVLSPEPLDMNEVVADIANDLEQLAATREATIRIEGKLPAIRHDRLAIDQIFQNLIENATKYGRNGVPNAIVVRGRTEGKRARFEIEDQGRGVAPDDHERIFELFRRSGSQDQQGEGIGLAHVRALAYRLGGTVTIRSALNEGSTFLVDLPVSYASEGE